MAQLDSLRTIAAFTVIASHFAPRYFQLYNWGSAGVQLFFVLSGFLITGILLRAKASNTDNVQNLKTFYIRRSIRIFPLYYLVVLFSIYYFPAVKNTWGWHMSYTVNFLMAHTGKMVGETTPLWSLGVEEQFYLVWPVLILFLPLRLLPVVMWAMLFIGPASRLYSHLFLTVQALSYLPTSCLDSLGVGSLLAISKAHYPQFFRYMARQRVLNLVSIATLSTLIYLKSAHHSFNGWLYILSPLPLSVVFASLVAKASGRAGGALGKILDCRPLIYLGKISYGLYVFHSFMPHISSELFRRISIKPQVWQSNLVSVVLTILISALSWKLFEEPINRLKDRFTVSEVPLKPTRDCQADEFAATPALPNSNCTEAG